MLDFEKLSDERKKIIEAKAITALNDYHVDIGNIVAGVDIMRYAQAGLYTSNLLEAQTALNLYIETDDSEYALKILRYVRCGFYKLRDLN